MVGTENQRGWVGQEARRVIHSSLTSVVSLGVSSPSPKVGAGRHETLGPVTCRTVGTGTLPLLLVWVNYT